jgi:hypothetical protein
MEKPLSEVSDAVFKKKTSVRSRTKDGHDGSHEG